MEPSLSSSKVRYRRETARLRCASSRFISASRVSSVSSCTAARTSARSRGMDRAGVVAAFFSRYLSASSRCVESSVAGRSFRTLVISRAWPSSISPESAALFTPSRLLTSFAVRTTFVASFSEVRPSCASHVVVGVPATFLADPARSASPTSADANPSIRRFASNASATRSSRSPSDAAFRASWSTDSSAASTDRRTSLVPRSACPVLMSPTLRRGSDRIPFEQVFVGKTGM